VYGIRARAFIITTARPTFRVLIKAALNSLNGCFISGIVSTPLPPGGFSHTSFLDLPVAISHPLPLGRCQFSIYPPANIDPTAKPAGNDADYEKNALSQLRHL
jgi:hypothetical protein